MEVSLDSEVESHVAVGEPAAPTNLEMWRLWNPRQTE
jgi:hypothetical protein